MNHFFFDMQLVGWADVRNGGEKKPTNSSTSTHRLQNSENRCQWHVHVVWKVHNLAAMKNLYCIAFPVIFQLQSLWKSVTEALYSPKREHPYKKASAHKHCDKHFCIAKFWTRRERWAELTALLLKSWDYTGICTSQNGKDNFRHISYFELGCVPLRRKVGAGGMEDNNINDTIKESSNAHRCKVGPPTTKLEIFAREYSHLERPHVMERRRVAITSTSQFQKLADAVEEKLPRKKKPPFTTPISPLFSIERFRTKLAEPWRHIIPYSGPILPTSVPLIIIDPHTRLSCFKPFVKHDDVKSAIVKSRPHTSSSRINMSVVNLRGGSLPQYTMVIVLFATIRK